MNTNIQYAIFTESSAFSIKIYQSYTEKTNKQAIQAFVSGKRNTKL